MFDPPTHLLSLDATSTPAACGSASGVPPEEGKTPGGSFSARQGRLFFNGREIAQCFHQFDSERTITTTAVQVAEALALTLNAATGEAVACG